MKTEIRKTLKSGFVLNEQELRRLTSVIKDQLENAHRGSPTKLTFLVKFRNGSISEPITVDEIFSQENSGSQSITKLTIKEVVIADPACAIEIAFASDNSEGEGGGTINYSITHDDKDWVFVTNSKIDERLSRIRIFSMKRVTSNSSLVLLISMMLGMLFLSIGLGFVMPSLESQNQAVQALARQYEHDKSYPVIEFIVKLDAFKSARSETGRYISTYIVLFFSLFLGVIYSLTKAAEYLFPSYNFLWGDYVELYRQRKAVSYCVFVVVLLGLALSLTANFISGRMF